MQLALVTGANGAIGRSVVGALARDGWRVAGLGHGPVQWIAVEPIDYWLAGDVTVENLDALQERCGAPDLVINLAGGSAVGPSLVTPQADFERTVSTTVRLLNWIWTRAQGAGFVYVSSAAIYGSGHVQPIAETTPANPLSPYGHHKYLAEQIVRYWARDFRIPSVILRPFSVYGPGLQKQLIFELCRKLASNPTQISLSGTGSEQRDWMEISDISRLIVALHSKASFDAPVFNGCTGVGTTILDTVKLLVECWGADTAIDFDGQVRPSDPAYLVGDASKLQSLDLPPFLSFRDGLATVVDNFRSRA